MVNYATDRGCGEKEYASKNLAQDGREWAGDAMRCNEIRGNGGEIVGDY